MKISKIILISGLSLFCMLAVGKWIGSAIDKKNSPIDDGKDKAAVLAALQQLETIIGALDTSTALVLKGAYALYDKETMKQLEEEPFYLIRQQGITYMGTGPIEQIYKAGGIAVIDHTHQSISVGHVADSMTLDLSSGSFIGALKKYVERSTGDGVKLGKAGDDIVVRIEGDSTAVYKPMEIVYNSNSMQLKSTSVNNTVIVPDSDDNTERAVVLKTTILSSSHVLNAQDIQMLNKIHWKKKKVETDASLKTYSINYAD